MEMTLKELEDELKRMRDKGAVDDTPVAFDGDWVVIDFDEDVVPRISYWGQDDGPGKVVINLGP